MRSATDIGGLSSRGSIVDSVPGRTLRMTRSPCGSTTQPFIGLIVRAQQSKFIVWGGTCQQSIIQYTYKMRKTTRTASALSALSPDRPTSRLGITESTAPPAPPLNRTPNAPPAACWSMFKVLFDDHLGDSAARYVLKKSRCHM